MTPDYERGKVAGMRSAVEIIKDRAQIGTWSFQMMLTAVEEKASAMEKELLASLVEKHD